MSTISVMVAVEIESEIHVKGAKMPDAPVSGGEKGANDTTLSNMVGGSKEVFRRCLPIFQAMGRTIIHVGEIGKGQTLKACNQFVCPLTIVAICEGLILGRKAGVDQQKLFEVVGAGLGGSNIWSSLVPKILKGDMEPGFKLKLQQKDLMIALSLADKLDVPLPATSIANQLFRIVQAEGNGDKGTQALISAYEKMSNL